jgi:hypothetical protein
VAPESLTDYAPSAPKTRNKVIGPKPKKKEEKVAVPSRKPPKPAAKTTSNGRINKNEKKTVKKWQTPESRGYQDFARSLISAKELFDLAEL